MGRKRLPENERMVKVSISINRQYIDRLHKIDEKCLSAAIRKAINYYIKNHK